MTNVYEVRFVHWKIRFHSNSPPPPERINRIPYAWNSSNNLTDFFPKISTFSSPRLLRSLVLLYRCHWVAKTPIGIILSSIWSIMLTPDGMRQRINSNSINHRSAIINRSSLRYSSTPKPSPMTGPSTFSNDHRRSISRNCPSLWAMFSRLRWVSTMTRISRPTRQIDKRVCVWWIYLPISFTLGKWLCRIRSSCTFMRMNIAISMSNHHSPRSLAMKRSRHGCRSFQIWTSFFSKVTLDSLIDWSSALFLLWYSDGQLSQERGHHVQVHYLFNNLISNLFHQPLNVDLLHAWKTLYQVSSEQNISTVRAPISHRSLFNKPLPSEMKNLKSIFLLTLMIFCLIILNFFICIFLTRRGHGCRKREYNCLDVHTPFNLNRPSSPLQPAQQPHSGSSPSSTNSNGTITQQLMVNTNCTTTTNSSLSSTPPVDILHPINITKKNGILRSSSRRRASLLPEAIV